MTVSTAAILSGGSSSSSCHCFCSIVDVASSSAEPSSVAAVRRRRRSGVGFCDPDVVVPKRFVRSCGRPHGRPLCPTLGRRAFDESATLLLLLLLLLQRKRNSVDQGLDL